MITNLKILPKSLGYDVICDVCGEKYYEVEIPYNEVAEDSIEIPWIDKNGADVCNHCKDII